MAEQKESETGLQNVQNVEKEERVFVLEISADERIEFHTKKPGGEFSFQELFKMADDLLKALPKLHIKV